MLCAVGSQCLAPRNSAAGAAVEESPVMRVWARTILVAAIGLVALIEPTGTLTAKGSAAANAVSRCPADGNMALAAFAVTVPN